MGFVHGPIFYIILFYLFQFLTISWIDYKTKKSFFLNFIPLYPVIKKIMDIYEEMFDFSKWDD